MTGGETISAADSIGPVRQLDPDHTITPATYSQLAAAGLDVEQLPVGATVAVDPEAGDQ